MKPEGKKPEIPNEILDDPICSDPPALAGRYHARRAFTRELTKRLSHEGIPTDLFLQIVKKIESEHEDIADNLEMTPTVERLFRGILSELRRIAYEIERISKG